METSEVSQPTAPVPPSAPAQQVVDAASQVVESAPPADVEEKKELRLVEKLLELNLGLTFILGSIVILAALVLVSWRFGTNLLGIAGIKDNLALPPPQNVSSPKIANANTRPVFINQQIVELKKSYSAPEHRVTLTVNGQLKRQVFGYLPYWAVDNLDQINTQLLTAISYFGLEVDSNGNIVQADAGGPQKAWQVWQSDQRLDNFLKTARRERIKVYLTFKAFDNDNIEKLVLSDSASKNFISNALYQMNAHSLDGINLDFEYVGTPDQKVIDGFSLLVSNLNKEMKRQYPKAILTVTTYINSASTTKLHDVPILAQNCDYLVIMAYDFHTPDSASAGPIAPMEGDGETLVGMMSSYLDKVPPEKLILAVGYYGYDWPVIDNNAEGQVDASAPVKVLTYADLADETKKVNVNWDDNSQTPWFSYIDSQTGKTRIVHFENARSLGIKYDYVNQKNLAGVGIWALGFDGQNTDLLQLLADKFAN